MRQGITTYIFLLLVLKGFSQSEKSRLNIGVGLNKTSYLFRADVKPSIQFGLGYEIADKVGVYGSFTTHKSINRTPADKTSIISLSVLPRLVGTYKSKFSWYFPAGASLVLMKDYYKERPLNQTGVTVNIGTGLHYSISKLRLFADFNMGFPLTEYEQKSLISGYGYISANVGIKVPFGSTK